MLYIKYNGNKTQKSHRIDYMEARVGAIGKLATIHNARVVVLVQ